MNRVRGNSPADTSHQEYYQALLSNYNPGLALSPAAKQIELDLLRTMPNNIYYENNHSKGPDQHLFSLLIENLLLHAELLLLIIISAINNQQSWTDFLRVRETKYFPTAGIPKLRRVLLAYSLHNPDIEYCQGFNRIAAIALLFLDEEEAFWCLLYILEVLLPESYYMKQMLGAQVDQVRSKKTWKVYQH